MTDYTGIAVRLRGSISDGWSCDAAAADANNAEEAAVALIEARDTIADMMEALRKAEGWLAEWASAEPYIGEIRAAIAKAEGRS